MTLGRKKMKIVEARVRVVMKKRKGKSKIIRVQAVMIITIIPQTTMNKNKQENSAAAAKKK